MAWPPIVPPATRANATAQLDNHPADHNAISAALTAILPTAWTALPFAAGWGNAATFQAAQYRLTGDRVELRGVITQTVLGNLLIATMPAGFRPPANQELYGTGFRTGADAPVRIDITTAGALTLPAAAGQVAQNVSLVSVSWWTS